MTCLMCVGMFMFTSLLLGLVPRLLTEKLKIIPPESRGDKHPLSVIRDPGFRNESNIEALLLQKPDRFVRPGHYCKRARH
jgi:hypothetical protein